MANDDNARRGWRDGWRGESAYRSSYPPRGPWRSDEPTVEQYGSHYPREDLPYGAYPFYGGRLYPGYYHPYGQPRYEDRYGTGRYDTGRPEYRRDFWDRAGDEVASWFGDEDAERRREMDHRGKGPRGYRRSDERINEDIHDRLSDDPYLDASQIDVTIKEGEVTLEGFVNDRADKRRAEDCAYAISGVKDVQNNLRLQTSRVPQAQSDVA